MGEVSHAKASGPKPRPLGLVKRESVHFEDVESGGPTVFPDTDTTASSTAPHSVYLFGRSKTDGSLRHELRSMRDLQETLRQAALLNIVAAVNHDNKVPQVPSPTAVTNTGPPSTRPGTQSVGIKGTTLLGHSTAGGGGISTSKFITSPNSGELHFSRHLQTAASTPGGPLAMPQNSALTQLLSARPRSISIPGPRTHDQGSFMHNSLMDAKEQLSNMTNFRGRPRPDTWSTMTPATLPPPTADGGVTSRDHDHTEYHPPSTSQEGMKSVDFTKTPHGYRVSGSDHGHHVNFSVADKSEHNLECPPPTRQFPQEQEEVNKLSKDEQRAHNVHQMQMLKRHISTQKKKELVKRLTEIAKCEAVDMSEPVLAEDSGPIIISGQPSKTPLNPEYLTSGTLLRRPASSLSFQKEETSRVPSNTRVQSETLESMTIYRDARRKGSFQVGDDLKIEAILGVNRVAEDASCRHSPEHSLPHLLDSFSNVNEVSTWLRDHQFGESIVGRNVHQPSLTPDVLELRPVDRATPLMNKTSLADRRRAVIIRRGLNPTVREKLLSPSPMVYEASYHRPKASTGQISLVGQSLPTLSICKPSTFSSKGGQRRSHDNLKPPSQSDGSTPVKNWNEPSDRPTRQGMRPWGSTVKPPTSSSPIFKTEILNHLQCKGIMERRPTVPTTKKSISRIKGHNRAPDADESDNDDFDVDDAMGLEATRPANYRKSKLYSAFRASEENLANMADTSSLVSDTLTARSLMNHPAMTHARSEGDLHPVLPSTDPVHSLNKEPRYMGCSSRVSEGEGRSQFHFVNGQEESDTKRGENFRVFKALDQDVYFDFQHRKYRGANTTNITLNTGTPKPRMHFYKVKYSGEAKS